MLRELFNEANQIQSDSFEQPYNPRIRECAKKAWNKLNKSYAQVFNSMSYYMKQELISGPHSFLF